jgi:hypothetical protein
MLCRNRFIRHSRRVPGTISLPWKVWYLRNCFWERLTGAGFGVLGVLLQQALVDIALHVGLHHHPLLPVDHVDDLEEHGRVLDLVLGLGEDLAQRPRTGAQRPQERDVVALQIRAPAGPEGFPGILGGDAHVPGVGGSGILVGHLQEDQVGELFQVVSVAHPGVAEDVAEAPDLGDDGGGVYGWGSGWGEGWGVVIW